MLAQLKAFFNNLPRTWKLLASVFLAAISIAFLALDIRTSIRQRDPAEYAASILPMRARRTAELAGAIEAISFQFLSNQLLNDTLASYVADSERYDVSKWNIVFSEHMEGLAETVPELEDAVFFDAAAGESRIPLTMSDSLTRSLWIPVRDKIMKTAMSADGQPVWSVLPGAPGNANRHDKIPSTLLCARLIKKRNNHTPLGVLILLIDPDRLARTVSGYSQDEGIAVSQKTDYCVLMSKDGTILASVDPSLATKPVSEAIPGYDDHFQDKLLKASPGSYKFTTARDDKGRKTSYWIVYSPVPDKEWLLVSILPISIDALPTVAKILMLLGFAGAAWLFYGSVGKAANKEGQGAENVNAQNFTLAELPEWITRLTPKEQTVLLFLLTGKSNKEIASLLAVREQTVKNHLSATYQRIGAQDRFSAIILMQEAGLTLESLRHYAEAHPDFPVDMRLFS